MQLSRKGITRISITDEESGAYTLEQKVFKPTSSARLPASSMSGCRTSSLCGPLDAMHLKAELPQGKGTLDLKLKALGPTLYNNGTGLFPFLDETSHHHYSLPNLQTTGTLTLDGSTKHVTGTSWPDRQWGNWNWDTLHKWTCTTSSRSIRSPRIPPTSKPAPRPASATPASGPSQSPA
ncbi:lipocalin-like domain-containing protein [Streptomyces sp. NPDC088116]|uniref:lipocalin-like domain-containing protein n=1 Tax=Streptomyces sp. NPDC088116 TaxID=3365825 RepID=UPI0037F9AD18